MSAFGIIVSLVYKNQTLSDKATKFIKAYLANIFHVYDNITRDKFFLLMMQ